jgi:hypothetical protein
VRVRPPPPALKINGFPPTTSSKQDYSIQLTATFDSHGLGDADASRTNLLKLRPIDDGARKGAGGHCTSVRNDG